MGFFGRRRQHAGGRTTAFWLIPPFSTHDAEHLHAHGIDCVIRSDGPGMMSTGWAIWNIAGLHEQEARDFLMDGYKAWCASGGADDSIRVEFLEHVFERLRDIEPPVSPSDDLSRVSWEVMAPIAEAYGMRCWAGSELLELLNQPWSRRRTSASSRGGAPPERRFTSTSSMALRRGCRWATPAPTPSCLRSCCVQRRIRPQPSARRIASCGPAVSCVSSSTWVLRLLASHACSGCSTPPSGQPWAVAATPAGIRRRRSRQRASPSRSWSGSVFPTFGCRCRRRPTCLGSRGARRVFVAEGPARGRRGEST